MRGAWLAAALLLSTVVPAVPAVSAQDAAPIGTRVIDDARGDPLMSTVDMASPHPNPFVDIVSLDVEEQEEQFVFRYQTGGIPDPPETPLTGSVTHEIMFEHADATAYIGIYRYVPLDVEPILFVYLSVSYGSGEYQYGVDLDYTLDDAGLLTMTIPRMMLADGQGAPPFPGRALGNFTARSTGQDTNIYIGPIQGGGLDESDTAQGKASVPVKLGVAQSGNARLRSFAPFRATNGEQATYVFQVEAANVGVAEDTYDLRALKLPANWKVTLPQSQVHLGAGASIVLPVLVEVPFAHVHGRILTFVVEMHGQRDAGSVGRVELGLQFMDPPQPGGHHDTLWFHSTAPSGAPQQAVVAALFTGNGPQATMNALTEDPHDEKAPVPARLYSEGLSSRAEWVIPLSPGLRMGIDGDLTREGKISVPLRTTLPMDGTVLGGRLIVVDYFDQFGPQAFWDGETLLADVVADATVAIGANEDKVLTGTLKPAESGDLVPFREGQQLLLLLEASFERPAIFAEAESPALLAGGFVQFPMIDYSDPVHDVVGSLGGMRLEVEGGHERALPPGSAVGYTIDLTGPAGVYRLSAYGAHNDWVRFNADEVTLESDNATVRLQAIVTVPEGTPSDIVDLVVEAAHMEELNARAVARLRLTIDPAAPVPELNIEQAPDARSPMPAAVLLAVALLALARFRRV